MDYYDSQFRLAALGFMSFALRLIEKGYVTEHQVEEVIDELVAELDQKDGEDID